MLVIFLIFLTGVGDVVNMGKIWNSNIGEVGGIFITGGGEFSKSTSHPPEGLATAPVEPK